MARQSVASYYKTNYMSDIIQLLPDSVANQIAAGEVIQRPASVVKELVENSVDAGATVINVVCMDSGRTSIQVVDNGKGMSGTDARLSFERHATSKIRQATDLFNLHTMGFRGEALASIAAVSQVQLKTRLEGDDVGTQISIAGSRFVSQEVCSCPVGSNFLIENLFYNVPVRRKFLKSNATELNNIITAFERIALVYPDVAFTLHNNRNELYNLKSGGLRQRIVDVFGKKINQYLLPIDIDTSMCKITGFVGKPESARKKGARQYFFVNGRYMKHPYFHKAVMAAYERLVPEGEQGSYFIYFTVNPEDIDVNIHPTKTEIKFENEPTIWQILAAAVKDAVGMFNDVTAIEFDTEGQPDIPALGGDGEVKAPRLQYNPSYNPFTEPSPRHSDGVPQEWERLYEGIGANQRGSQPSLFPESEGGVVRSKAGSVAHDGIMQSRHFSMPSIPDPIMPGMQSGEASGHEDESQAEHPSGASVADGGKSPLEEKSPVHYQYKGQYIMTAVKSGLMIIDQHRAHTRILYERYLANMAEHKPHSQKVLFPESVHFDQADNAMLQKLLPELDTLGFELADIGGGSYSINSVPAGIEGLNYVALVQDLVSSAREESSSAIDDMNHSLALGLARHAAVSYGEVLGNDEMENIVNDLFACSNFNYTPDGKRVLTMLPQTEIERLLG